VEQRTKVELSLGWGYVDLWVLCICWVSTVMCPDCGRALNACDDVYFMISITCLDGFGHFHAISVSMEFCRIRQVGDYFYFPIHIQVYEAL